MHIKRGKATHCMHSIQTHTHNSHYNHPCPPLPKPCQLVHACLHHTQSHPHQPSHKLTHNSPKPCLTHTTQLCPQVLTVFLGSFIAGSLFTQFQEWTKNPASAVTIIGTSAPLTSIFFLNYIELGVRAFSPPHLLCFAILPCLPSRG